MKNVILLSAVLFALSQVNVIIDADQALYIDGMFLVMGAEVPFEKLVGLHLAMVPFTISCTVILTVMFAYIMEVIEKK